MGSDVRGGGSQEGSGIRVTKTGMRQMGGWGRDGGEGCSGNAGGGTGLFGLVVACLYTYHSFLEMTEPSV